MTDDFISSILSGDRRAIAKAISMIENEDSKISNIISEIYPKTGNAFVIGITGPPGTGKSTLINRLIENYRKLDKKIGVIAIDPSSPITGGSLLGDRLRMSNHNLDPNVYIRSMSSGDKSGGLSRYTRRSLSILDASGLDKKIGVIAIDPSSPITGGSLLGDRLRMSDHNLDPNVYIRSMSSGDKSGGLSRYTRRSLSILDASGLDIIIVESVGAGQSEVDILKITDAVVIVLMPELGDDIQIYKAGLMEVGDIFVVNKSDLDSSDQMYTKLLNASKIKNDKWIPQVVKTNSITGSGIDRLITSLSEREKFLTELSEQSLIHEHRIKNEILDVMLDDFSKSFSKKILNHSDFQNIVDQVLMKKMDPEQAAAILKKRLNYE